MKERFRSSLNSNCHQWAKLLQELDELSQGIEATVDRKLCKETEIRMGILQTALRKVKTSINENKDHLKESWMREENALQETGTSPTLTRTKTEMLLWKECKRVALPVWRPQALPYPL